MKIQTMSVVVGSKACQAQCPFCISKTTGFDHLADSITEPNWRNFNIACKLAARSGVSTILLTGKGEPTLYPKLITQYLGMIKPYDFPFIELQTNGIEIEKGIYPYPDDKDYDYLMEWYDEGLTTVSISMVHYDSVMNRKIYQPHIDNYMHLGTLIQKITKTGLNVRLSCIMLKGYIDNCKELDNLIKYCNNHGVKQLTVRPMTAPENKKDETTAWIEEHHLTEYQIMQIQAYLDINGTPVLKLAHGATVYDVHGQNVCFSTCLTNSKSTEDIRQIIFYPDGTVSHSWQYGGAILL